MFAPQIAPKNTMLYIVCIFKFYIRKLFRKRKAYLILTTLAKSSMNSFFTTYIRKIYCSQPT